MKRSLAALFVGASLSACAFYVTPEPSTSVRVRPIPTPSQPKIIATEAAEISEFVSARGEGSVYNLGETVSFQVRTTTGGYLTLTAYGAGGESSVLAQSVYLQGGVSTSLPTAESGVTYTLAPPRGLQRVTATLSTNPGGSIQDTAETSFYIQ